VTNRPATVTVTVVCCLRSLSACGRRRQAIVVRTVTVGPRSGRRCQVCRRRRPVVVVGQPRRLSSGSSPAVLNRDCPQPGRRRPAARSSSARGRRRPGPARRAWAVVVCPRLSSARCGRRRRRARSTGLLSARSSHCHRPVPSLSGRRPTRQLSDGRRPAPGLRSSAARGRHGPRRPAAVVAESAARGCHGPRPAVRRSSSARDRLQPAVGRTASAHSLSRNNTN
jgi:hypothetical protein